MESSTPAEPVQIGTQAAEEPVTEKPLAPTNEQLVPDRGRQALRQLHRELTDDDLKSPGTQKMLLEMLATAELECDELKGYVDKYHEADKNAAVLQVKVDKERGFDVLYSLCLAVGGAALGWSSAIWSPKNNHGEIALWIGVALIIVSAVARLFKK